jgi:hypothetical protein
VIGIGRSRIWRYKQAVGSKVEYDIFFLKGQLEFQVSIASVPHGKIIVCSKCMISSRRQLSILFRDGELIELMNGSFKEVDLILFKHNVHLKQLIGSNHCSVKWFVKK